MSCIGVSSFRLSRKPQILTSMSSVVGEGSCTLNHGGELKVQQELVGTSFIRVTSLFIKTTSKGPDVLARGAVSNTDSYNVVAVN